MYGNVMIINYLRGKRLFDLQWRKRTATAGDAQAYWNSTGLISKLPGSIKSSLSSSLFLLLDEKFFLFDIVIDLLKSMFIETDWEPIRRERTDIRRIPAAMAYWPVTWMHRHRLPAFQLTQL